MRSCEQYEGAILEMAEDRIDAGRRAWLEAHLAECEACRRALRVQASVRDALRGLPFAPVSAGFSARVRDRLVPSWFDVANWRVWTLRLAPVAALLCLFALWPSAREEAPQTLSAQLQSFATSGATDTQKLVVDAEVSVDTLLSAALGETSR